MLERRHALQANNEGQAPGPLSASVSYFRMQQGANCACLQPVSPSERAAPLAKCMGSPPPRCDSLRQFFRLSEVLLNDRQRLLRKLLQRGVVTLFCVGIE